VLYQINRSWKYHQEIVIVVVAPLANVIAKVSPLIDGFPDVAITFFPLKESECNTTVRASIALSERSVNLVTVLLDHVKSMPSPSRRRPPVNEPEGQLKGSAGRRLT
jgi:hypothetical protein